MNNKNQQERLEQIDKTITSLVEQMKNLLMKLDRMDSVKKIYYASVINEKNVGDPPLERIALGQLLPVGGEQAGGHVGVDAVIELPRTDGDVPQERVGRLKRWLSELSVAVCWMDDSFLSNESG
ncbi:hypothetical protein NQ318_018197 [Aromia moschata]|uniref:Uncharacterized protein n=1 Tax=Aromia moschata TaxID=1265417 RepID=A0AAV8ZCQ7_9CUCU|nr:hypothetical protein NQ318_018197 [Aromia moschata]